MATLNFKKLLTKILQRLSVIGKIVKNEPSAVSCQTSYYRQLASVTLDKGTWIISGVASFPYNNTTGVRRVYVTEVDSNYDNVTTAPAAVGNMLYNQVPITGSYQAYVHVGPMPVEVNSTNIYRLIGWQNSGSTVSVTGRIYAVRVA